MRGGSGGSHGTPGNEQSASCTSPEGLVGSNPILTAVQNPYFIGNRGFPTCNSVRFSPVVGFFGAPVFNGLDM
jgi:hypothetical protein